MLTFDEAANLSARVEFNIIHIDEYGIYDCNNVVPNMPVEQFLEKLDIVNLEWYQTARINCDKHQSWFIKWIILTL